MQAVLAQLPWYHQIALYALGDKTQPMSIAEYKLIESLPDALKTNLPSIEQIENELQTRQAR